MVSKTYRPTFRQFAVRRFVVASLAALFVLTTACSGGSSDEGGDNDNSSAPAPGVEIPQVDVNFGMLPYGDHSIASAGIAKGWFKEVGINIGPSKFPIVEYDQIVPSIATGNYDMTSQWSPNQLLIMASAPNIRQFTFSDYGSDEILAPPNSGAKTVAELVESGTPFEEAIKEVMGQLVGKRVAVDDTGAGRAFLNTVWDLGGVKPDDFGKFIVVDDSTMLQMARGGQLDFAKPVGQAQKVELVLDGWYQVVTVEDVAKGLPSDDPRGVLGFGQTGLTTTQEYFDANHDTILRVAGVMYRIIDAILKDIDEGTSDEAIGSILPVLESAAGVDIGEDGLRTLYENFSVMRSFEDQEDWWLNTDSPLYYKTVYKPQIAADVKGGALPSDLGLTAEDAFGLGEQVYRELVDLRAKYDELLPQATGLEGEAAKRAEQAKSYYDHRDYLDAYRFLAAAVEGA